MNQQLPPSPPARLDAHLASLPPADSPETVALNESLHALPDLQAPESIWPAVRERIDSSRIERRRSGRWQMPAALAAGVMLALSIGLTLRSPAPPSPSAALELPTLIERSQLAERRRRAVALPASTGTEHILRARIGGIDASLNRMLWQEAAGRTGAAGAVGTERRNRLLRERVDLLESLRHIEQDRREALYRQALL